jgi:hypothetical protein
MPFGGVTFASRLLSLTQLAIWVFTRRLSDFALGGLVPLGVTVTVPFMPGWTTQ